MTPEQRIAWLAGIYEGEGNVYSTISRGARRISLTIVQKDTWLLHKAKEILVSDLGIPESSIGLYLGSRKQTSLQVQKFELVDQILTAMWVWLSPRRKEQAAICLTFYSDCTLEMPNKGRFVDSELTYTPIRDEFPGP